mmetsp:Transcript_29836/g.46175  ORF Transcript_29836/g.46175 Transcript_29836/m.46175 type:complete len:132 (-) Transcript_29836:58-453(-)|eukprot:CAMPEP_0201513924 /NCGR_PEP_ID=MMETSP0161_2-20130828/5880_1 /ASSEMBLY_ACC=CAM_ASM_000251 /TAXON_ID=180227 /ORGANISM="Neoparamoeba aestuarina, Strain SoJaBio B1-5/56/2" /LENGTH=131 /DNA_ID=CAMNT_0047910317 /DNA_START=243 /DNA_END=638 /DNA_ORIENTATION=+
MSMNRAAEASMRDEAVSDIFTKAIDALTIASAKEIFQGDEPDAGTKFLSKTCSEELNTAVTPCVIKAMEGTNVHETWAKLKKAMSKSPMTKKTADSFDLIQYIVQGTMKGLFTMCEQYEVEYRTHIFPDKK